MTARRVIRADASALVRDWTFTPSRLGSRLILRRWRAWLTGCQKPPRHSILRRPVPASRWNALFLYLPTGELDADQRETLGLVRRLSGKTLVIAALPHLSAPLPDALAATDALVVKELTGFDFSAYRLALQVIATHSPGATLFCQNDSVLGPFGDLDALLARSPWELTGFMASNAIENHFSGYAWMMRDVTPARVKALRPVLSPRWSCNAFHDVVLLQETRFARVASRTMSVGAFWYLPAAPSPVRSKDGVETLDITADATLSLPTELLDRGHPFLKRSLWTKFSDVADKSAVEKALSRARSLSTD